MDFHQIYKDSFNGCDLPVAFLGGEMETVRLNGMVIYNFYFTNGHMNKIICSDIGVTVVIGLQNYAHYRYPVVLADLIEQAKKTGAV